MIDPKSTAGVLLREFHSAAEALAYAERMARRLGAMSNGIALDYWQAAKELKELSDQTA